MKKLAIALAATAVLATSAFAADIPVRAPVYKAPPPAPVHSWTGGYVGAGGGYGMWNQENTLFDDADIGALTTPVTTGGRGYFGTVQGGCDYQIGSKWVIGVFGDYDFSSIKGNS